MKLIATLAVAAVLAGCNATKPSSTAPSSSGIFNKINTGNAGEWSNKYRCSGEVQSVPEAGTIIFKASKNKCGAASQRSEIISRIWHQNEKKKLVLTANVAIDADIPFNKYGKPLSFRTTLFQVASMTTGCNPAASFTINSNGGTRTYTGYKHKRGANPTNITSTCTHTSTSGPEETDSKSVIPMDGTPFDLKVEYDFMGKGAFEYVVYVNGERVDAFKFERPIIATSNKEFKLKFGLYSGPFSTYYPYTMTVKNFRVDKVDKLSDEFNAAFN